MFGWWKTKRERWEPFETPALGQLELQPDGGMRFGPYTFGPTEPLEHVYIDGCQFARQGGKGQVMRVTVPAGPTLLVKFEQGVWYHRPLR